MYSFAALTTFQYLGIALSGFLLTGLFLFFLLREQKSYIAIDGTKFSSEKACEAYNKVFERVNLLYIKPENKSESTTLGLSASFIRLLKERGFEETKTLIKYREEFIRLSKLLSTEN